VFEWPWCGCCDWLPSDILQICCYFLAVVLCSLLNSQHLQSFFLFFYEYSPSISHIASAGMCSTVYIKNRSLCHVEELNADSPSFLNCFKRYDLALPYYVHNFLFTNFVHFLIYYLYWAVLLHVLMGVVTVFRVICCCVYRLRGMHTKLCISLHVSRICWVSDALNVVNHALLLLPFGITLHIFNNFDLFYTVFVGRRCVLWTVSVCPLVYKKIAQKHVFRYCHETDCSGEHCAERQLSCGNDTLTEVYAPSEYHLLDFDRYQFIHEYVYILYSLLLCLCLFQYQLIMIL